MPIAAPSKTWQFDVNNTITGASAILAQAAWWIALKDALVGFASNPWEIGYSCDGAVAGAAGDAVDRWVDTGDLVYATSEAVAHSWSVLVNPVTGMELLIECITTSVTTGKVIRLVVSGAAGFTGGSTTDSPAATDERVILSGAASQTFGLGLGTNTTAPEIIGHFLHSSDGEVTIIAMDHANDATALAYFGVPDSAADGWPDALVAGWYANIDSVTTPVPATLELSDVYLTTVATLNVPRLYGLNYPAAGGAGGELHLISPAVAVDGGGGNAVASVCETRHGNVPSTNDFSGEEEMPRIGLYSALSGDRGTVGRFFDTRWVGDNLTTGDTVPDDGSREWCVQGPWLIPWDGTVPAVA